MAKRKGSATKEAYELFLKELDEAQRIQKAAKDSQDERESRETPGLNEARKIAYEFAQMTGAPLGNVQRPEDLNKQDVFNYLDSANKLHERNASNVLDKNLEGIVREQISDESLEMLALDQEFAKTAQGDETLLISLYRESRMLSTLIEGYERGAVNEEGENKVRIAAMRGADKAGREKAAEITEKFGYKSEGVQDMIAGLYTISVKERYASREQVIAYAKDELDAELKEIKKIYEEKGDVKDAIRNMIIRLAEGSQEELKAVKDIIYKSAKADEARKAKKDKE